MATFKAVVQKQRGDKLWPVYIRVYHNGERTFVKTDKLVNDKGVNLKNHEVKDPFVLRYTSKMIADWVERINRTDVRGWSCSQLVVFLKSDDEDICFSDYAREYRWKMIDRGQARNARNYELAYQHLERFAGTTKIMFSYLTSSVINKWIGTMANTHRAKEMYPICIRQIFKAALLEYNDYDRGVIRIRTNPWPKVRIPKADTAENGAITMDECREFFNSPLPETDRIVNVAEMGRDVAKMILCLAGINSADLYALKKKDYRGGILHYKRAKTRRFRADEAYIEMRVPDFLRPTVEKWTAPKGDEWLFRFHTMYHDADSFNAGCNAGIKKINRAYSCYTFRYTWATVAQHDVGATVAEVGFALNHSQSKVTRGYIGKMDFSPAWELNEKVVEMIFFSDKKGKADPEAEDQKTFRISFRHLTRGTLYFKGRTVYQLEDDGYNNVEEVIGELMKHLPDDIPPRSVVQIRIENVDKNLTAFYERMVK